MSSPRTRMLTSGMASVNAEILLKQDLESPDSAGTFSSSPDAELDARIYESTSKTGKEKQVSHKTSEDDKPKQKTKRSLIPFYSTFVFGNRGSKSPEKEKRKKVKGESKLLLSDDNDDEQEKKDEEKEDSKDVQNGRSSEENEADGTSGSDAPIYTDNKSCRELQSNRDEVDSDLPDEGAKKCLASPKFNSKNDSKKYSLVKSRIAKYQKNTASQKDKSISSYEGSHKSKTLEHPSRSSVVRSKFSTLDAQSRHPNQVSNLSYESVEFPGSYAFDLKDVECDRQALYDELKLIYNDGEIYAVKGSKADPIYSMDEETGVLRPHLSIDSITLISNKNMKASLNISVSGNSERVTAALPDTRWREAGKFSRRSIRKSTSKKKSEAKKCKSSSGNSSSSTSPPNEPALDDRLSGSDSLNSYRDDHWSQISQEVLPSFPEYAKVNKKKNGNLEAQPSLDSLSLDYRKIAFRGCGEKGPVAKKIGQCAWRQRKETDKKYTGPVKKTDSFKTTKVVRKGSFSHSVRPKVVKKVAQNFQDLESENSNKPSGVKLRRRDSRNGGKEGYRLSVTIQPRTVASLTNKFNSLISQNLEAGPSGVTQIPLGHVAIKDRKLGRVYHSPRASFKRKYRTKNHKNKRSARVHSPEIVQIDKRDLNELQTSSSSSLCPAQDTDMPSPSTHSQKPRRPIVNIQKVPSIGRGPGDNKTDEEKVCDKIETALSSGKFKGETDESDAEHEDDVSKKSEEITTHQGTVEASIEPNPVSSSSIASTNSCPGTEENHILEEKSELSNGETSPDQNNDDNANASEAAQCEDQQSPDETYGTESNDASFASLSSGVSVCHQKSESIDSGIAADEAVAALTAQKIPAIMEERRVVGILGCIDLPQSGNNDGPHSHEKFDALQTCEQSNSENSAGNSVHSPDNGVILEEMNETDCKSSEEKVTPGVCTADDDSSTKTSITTTKKESSDVPSEQESAEKLDKGEIDVSEKNSGTEEPPSEGDGKIYSSIFKAVVKNTVRKTKEKDSLKKESDREAKLSDKESWFKRSRSKERTENTKSDEKSKNVQSPNECSKAASVSPQQNSTKDDTETGAKPKKEKDGKIYESWIFKKIREKSQERKKFKDFTPVNVDIENENAEEDVSQELDASKVRDLHSKSSSNDSAVQKVEQSQANNQLDSKKSETESSGKKDESYGLFNFRSRGRTKDRKKTKNSSDKSCTMQDASKESNGVVNEKESSTEGSMTGSPTSSVRTLHSRKLSDTSVCTVESESVCSKASSTKLKASNSQRSTSSIPPPPKTPIPSPPKSARIVLRLKDDEDDDDSNDKDEAVGKGSSENIYENLYSVDLDKLKKNRAKLEERGIVPNSSFLWNDGNPVNVPVDEVSSRNQILERHHPFSKITGIKSFGQPHRGRRDSSLPRMDLARDDGPNYSELQPLGGTSDDSHANAAYDEIGGLSSMSYDDIRMSSSCSYDDIRAPSSVGYDSIKAPSSGGGYDLVNPPPARSDSSQYDECDGGVVTAQLAVVKEDQLDSISYLYDDITYNASQTSHSYEPVNPPGVNAGVSGSMPTPLVISSIQEVPEPESSPSIESNVVEGSDEEEGGEDPHEVFSYTLTQLGDPSTAAETARRPDRGSSEDSSEFQDTTASPGALDATAPATNVNDTASVNTQPPSPLEDPPPALLGLRDSLRSSVSSYHSAYSTRYFTRAKVEATRAKEEECASQTSDKQKKPKINDEVKESRFGFMGRKIRELSKLGKLRNSEKETAKKIRDKLLEIPSTSSAINEDDLPLEGTNVSAMEPLDIEINEAIYGTNAVSNDLYSAACGAELLSSPNMAISSTIPTTSKKSRKPKLTLSDCTPLPEDFHSYTHQPGQSTGHTYGSYDGTHDNHGNFYGVIYAQNSVHCQMQDAISEQDEWEDLSDDLSDEELPPLSPGRVQRIVRAPVRAHRWGSREPRGWRKTWSQGVRDVTTDSLVNNRSYSQCSNTHCDDSLHSPSPRCLHSSVANIRSKPSLVMQSQATSAPAFGSKSSTKGRSRNGRSRKNSTRRRTLFVQEALYGPFDLENERYVSEHVVRSRMRPSRKQKYRLESRHQADRELGRYRRRGHHDSDGEASSHYEAIYEAISEQHNHSDLQNNVSPVENGYHTTTETLNEEDEGGSKEDYDDSFDSDYSDEAYSRLHPQCLEEGQYSSPGLERQESQGSSDAQYPRPIPTYHRQNSLGSASSGTQSITKFAEAANLGMRKLRRNWSQTKTEVKTGLNKMKKKGNSPSIDGRSSENIYNDASPSSEEKPKWSLKNFGRRKSTSSLMTPSQSISLVPADKDKETATFYLTLTIETDKRDAALAAAAAEASQRLKGIDLKNMELLKGVDGTDLRSVLELGRIANVGVVERPKSCIGVGAAEAACSSSASKTRSKHDQRRASNPRPVRPKNAPPAPPSDFSESEDSRSPDGADCSKDRLAMRLNQILLAGPTSHRGRKILRSSVGSSSESSPVPVLVPPEASPTSPVPTAFKQISLSTPSPSSSRGATLPSTSKYSLKASKSCDELNVDDPSGRLAEEVTAYIGRNLHKTRSTTVNSTSNSSSESCTRPSLSSVPPPLPARPTGQQRLRKSTQGDPSSPSTPTSPVQTTIPENFTENDNRTGLDYYGDSTLPQSTEEPTYISSHFADEPLYQFYTASVLERATYRQGECGSEDDYEVINDGSDAGVPVAVGTRPTAMEIVTPADGRRTLWCELPEVLSSGILNTLTSGQRKVQEAMFEVITSEASYLKSLEVLVSHFLSCPQFASEAILSKREKNILFSDILPVKRCSEAFLADLEKRWQESALISTIADIVLKHAGSTFNVYVKYCSNQIYQDRMLKQLKESNPRFMETLTELESSPKCQSLAMHSFLMLPMQRITRLPLLLDAIFHRLEHGSPHWHECNLALATLNKIVTECNEGARKMERMEEMLIISRQLDFREVRAVPLISASRWLVKKGELTRLTWRDLDTKLTFGKRISKHSLYFFLFTDLLVVTKKKSEDSYTVLDHCPRNMVQVLELENSDKPPGRWLEGHKNLLIVTMLQNHENKTVEMVLSCALESERTRWVEAVTPRTSDNPDEQIYEEWDCPQVQAVHPYSGSQPDELSLEVSDVVNVLKKMADGWYQGERLRDGERGWFPGSYCKEIASAHVRARNLRQRYRLLAISGSMVEEIRRSADATNDKEGASGKTEKEEKKERRKTVTMKDVIYSQTIK